jgi:hypothetical protein
MLVFTIGDRVTTLAAGDSLFALIDRPTRLEAPGPLSAEYLVIQEPS